MCGASFLGRNIGLPAEQRSTGQGRARLYNGFRFFNTVAKLIDRPLIKKVTPVAPEHGVGDLIQSGHPLLGLVWINPERVSGAPCFFSTRVPITTLFRFAGGGPNAR
jgi:hypothetical protein